MAIRILSAESIDGVLSLPDGSVSAPAIGNTGDANTGMYWPGDHQLGFAVNGSRKFYMSTTKAFFQNLSSGVEISAGGIDVTGNSTFSGSVTTGGTIIVNNVGADKKIAFRRTSANNWSIEHDSSQLYFYNETSSKDILLMKNGGQIMLGEYGSGTFTGTTAYTLAVDSSGNIIETTDGGGDITGSGVNNRLAIWSGTKTIDSDSDFYVDADTLFTANLEASGNGTFSGTISAVGASTFTLNDGIFIKAVNGTNNVAATNVWGYGLYEGASKLGEISLVRDGTNSQMYMGTTGANQVLSIGSANKVTALTIDASQNVGIGTVNPSAKLHVNGVVTANDSIQVQNDDSGFICRNAAGTVIGTIGAESSSTPNIGMFTVRNNGNNKIVLNSNGDSYFISGDVAIGTTSPDAPLCIHGGTGLGIGASGLRVHRPDSFGQFGFFDYGQSSGTTYIGSSYTGGSAAVYGVITFRQLSNGGAAKDTMVISSDNNVGIGTTSPNPFAWGNKHLTVLAAGTNQYAAVDIIGSGNAAGAILFGGGSGSGTATNVGRAQISAHDGSHLVFATNGSNSGSSFTERMRITSDGNVGINTTTPLGTGTKLQVNSNSHSQMAAHFGQGQNNSSGVFGGISLGYTEANDNYRKVAIVAKAIADGAARQDLHFLVDTVSDAGSAGIADSKMSIAATTGYVTINERLGIGNTTPAGDLDVSGPYAFFGTEVADNGITYLTLRNYDSTLVDTNDVQNMIRMTGRYWSGATSQLVETRISSIHQESNGNGGSALGFSTQTGGDTPVEHMRIDKVGNVGIGTTSPSGALHVYNGTSERFLITGDVHVQGSTDFNINGTSRRINFTSGTGTIRTTTANNLIFQTDSTTRFTVANSGTVTATGDVVAYSDERLKTNIETLDGSKVYKMRGVSFIKDEIEGSGVIAQELEKVAPELVNNDGEYKAVAYGNITGYLIEAIKELKAEIEELKKSK